VSYRQSDDIPYKSQSVTLIHPGRKVFENTVTGKRELLRSVRSGSSLIAVWAGQYRTDAFEVDLKRAREQVG
jgi:hypothetical protein